MAEEKSPYGSYDDQAAQDGPKHRKEEAADTGDAATNETLDSLKAAGASAFGLAKDFTNRFREDRSEQSKAQETEETVADAVGEEKKESFFDRASGFAKDITGSVRRAAEETRESESYSDAKEKVGSAFGVVREEATDAVNTVKERMNERKENKAEQDSVNDSAASKGDDVADPTAEVIEGEVISTDEDNK
ncbi:CGLAU_01105 family protein [Corynebacterium sp. L4756]|uniref:CGLAU_01105 family protein n=1 Tax=unclassified Corynebacterium TaxID=2624378 RepID=UPI00374D4EB0